MHSGMRVTVGMIVGATAAGRTVEDLLTDFPYLEERKTFAKLRVSPQVSAKDAKSVSPVDSVRKIISHK